MGKKHAIYYLPNSKLLQRHLTVSKKGKQKTLTKDNQTKPKQPTKTNKPTYQPPHGSFDFDITEQPWSLKFNAAQLSGEASTV